MILYNLESGLKHLGATKAEICFRWRHKMFPNGEPVIIETQRNKKFYKLFQCQQLLNEIRARKNKASCTILVLSPEDAIKIKKEIYGE